MIGEGDVRYWMLAGSDMGDMESAVLDLPHNIPMWLKLAYKKLHDEGYASLFFFSFFFFVHNS